MILATPNGNQRFGLFDSSTPIPRPGYWGSTFSYAGERITFAGSAGLPAFLRGVRLLSETAAGLPFLLYRGYGQGRKPQANAGQLALLRRPNPDVSPFSVWQYQFAAMLRGNAYFYKLKVRQRPGGMTLKFLYPVNPAFVTAKYDGDRAEFDLRDREYGPVVKTVGKDQIIHIPGVLLEDPYIGVSVVEAHRNGLGTELARQRFEGRYIHNDAAVSTILQHNGPGSPGKDQRDELRRGYESRHAGADHAGRVGMVWGGWDVKQMPLNLQDAQFIESKRYSVQDIGRMLGIPSGLLNDPDAPGGDSPEQENMRFLTHGLQPWIDRLTDALVSDPDLFPEPDWSAEMDTSGYLRADIQTRWNSYRLGRQGGWITANEIRAKEGLPAVDGGDEIQQTPVGGAANPSQGAPSDNSNDQGGGDAAG